MNLLLYVSDEFELRQFISQLTNNYEIENIYYFSDETISSVTINGINVHSISRYPKLDGLNLVNNYECTNLNMTAAFSEMKLNLFSILRRFVRTLGLNSEVGSIESYSNKLINFSCEFLFNNDIKLIIYRTVPHHPFTYSLYMVSTIRNIQFYFFRNYPDYHFFPESIVVLISKNLSCDDVFSEDKDFDLNTELSHEMNLIYNSVLCSTPLFKQNIYIPDESYKFNLSKIAGIFLRFYIRKKSIRNLFNGVYYRLYDLIFRFKDLRLMRYVNKVSENHINELFNKKFIFYPLHYQPEATTSPLGNHFKDQYEVIRKMLLYLDEDYYLVVKEHPAYWIAKPNYGSHESMVRERSVSFYENLIRHKRTILVHHKINSQEILRLSRGAITITGTIALEAMVIRKPVLVFGDTPYLFQPNSYNGNSNESIKKFMTDVKDDLIYQNKEFTNRVRTYLAKIDASSYSISSRDNSDFSNSIKPIFDEIISPIKLGEIRNEN